MFKRNFFIINELHSFCSQCNHHHGSSKKNVKSNFSSYIKTMKNNLNYHKNQLNFSHEQTNDIWLKAVSKTLFPPVSLLFHFRTALFSFYTMFHFVNYQKFPFSINVKLIINKYRTFCFTKIYICCIFFKKLNRI